MSRQLMMIRGGTSFDTHEDYIQFIKTRDLDLDRLKGGDDWAVALPTFLGDSFEVLRPRMPNTTNARYEEWKIWFERCLSFLRDDVILIGHSLGGIFLAKYISENDVSIRIAATILIAAPFDDASTDESLNDFALPSSLEKFAVQSGVIYLFQSKDDPVVPFGELEKYQRLLPDAKPMIFEDRKHFNQEAFPELIALIKSL